VPSVNADVARRTFAAVHQAIDAGLVRACHDLSEGGLAVAVAEMAFAGGCGARIEVSDTAEPAVSLFSESNTRFLCEVVPADAATFERTLAGIPLAKLGEVNANGRVTITVASRPVVDSDIRTLKESWQSPLRW
jgi:phosphoribosylformylglycinamidine synthase